MNEIVDLIQKARRFLKSAELLLADGDFDSCVSRCYYAMFFMAEAALLTKGFRASSHKGVISLFGEQFIKSKLLREEIGKVLRRAYDSRQKGDYTTGFIVSEREANHFASSYVSPVSKFSKTC